MGTARTLLCAAATVLVMAGCAPRPPLPASQITARIDVPFVPPRSERCAATSIEMVAEFWRSRSTFTPLLSGEELDARTLLPEKAGTLQAELVAAARADGLLVYMLDPTFEALYTALEAGTPPILLLNRGLSWYALWHYAPVTGYDTEARTILSHFADSPDEAIPLRTLAALWERSGNWGVLLLPPGFVPPLATPDRWLRSAYDLERTGMAAQAITAYESGIARLRETARGQIMGLEQGMLKLLISLEERKLLGVHILGEGATELIHIGQAVYVLGGTLDYFLRNIFNYPTLAEAYKVAALDAWNRMET